MNSKNVMAIQFFAILMLSLSVGCSPVSTPPGPTMAGGKYGNVVYEYFHWQEGLDVMIWHDAAQSSYCGSSGSTDSDIHVVLCQATSVTNQTFDWQIESNDGLTGEITLNNNQFFLSDGNVFIVSTGHDPILIHQFQRDLSGVEPNRESIIEFGQNDPDITNFIQLTNGVVGEEVSGSASSIPTMAYLGPDKNVWVLEAGSETPRQITFDAKLADGSNVAIEYGFPRLSSDGVLLAYQMEVGTPISSGYESTSGLWVENLTTGEKRQIIDSRPAGFAWKPGTHLLAYGTAVEMDYFITRGEPDAGFATGISAIDLDSDETLELVAPERGYALYGPQWSPDGLFLAFAEVINMEGSGLFAYYDLENHEYVAWDEPVGHVSWSPDGNLLTYARHTYAASGEERLYMRPRQGNEQLLGPDYDGLAFATHPIFSPTRDQIAYLAFLDGPMTDMATIMVLDLAGGEPKSLGQFEGVWDLSWVPDGSRVVFGFGDWESRQIVALNVDDGSQTVIADGNWPALAGQ